MKHMKMAMNSKMQLNLHKLWFQSCYQTPEMCSDESAEMKEQASQTLLEGSKATVRTETVVCQ